MPKQSKKNTKEFIQAVGRRKEAVARARIYSLGKEKELTMNGTTYHKGDIIVNDRPFKDVFKEQVYYSMCLKPFVVTDTRERFVTTIRVSGGGQNGQVEAIIHAIARALNTVDKEQYGQTLRSNGLLTRNAKVRERRMVGTGGKSRRRKQSPKR